MSEMAKKTLEEFEKAIKEGKITDFDLGYIYCLAMQHIAADKQ